MKVALVHDWLGTYRGGEKVLASLARLYPDASIFTLFYRPDQMPPEIRQRRIMTPRGVRSLFGLRKLLFPALPALIESLDLRGYDLVISSSSCVAKGALVDPQARHVCYIHSPMRYAWDQRWYYLGFAHRWGLIKWIYECFLSKMRLWDQLSSQRVDLFIANSHFVADRVRRYYRRDAMVLHPGIPDRLFDFPLHAESPPQEEPYYLIAGALVPYKNVHLAIQACRELNRRLIIVGQGPEKRRLQRLASSKIEWHQAPKDEDMQRYMRQARALIFPGIEDFGLVPIEAMSQGTPVIGLRQGGARDYLVDRVNSVCFDYANTEELKRAILRFEKEGTADAETIRQSVINFKESTFEKKFLEICHSFLDREHT